jgi:hypothetical protein
MRARELRTDMEHAAVKVDVVPGQAEQLGDPQPGVERGRDHQPVARRARPKEPFDLVAAEDSLAPPRQSRPLVGLELVDWVDRDPSMPARVANDAMERRERARGGLRRAALGVQPVEQSGDVVDRQRTHPSGRERGQQVMLEVVAV